MTKRYRDSLALDGLDPIIREDFLESILRANIAGGRTVLFSSHHVDDVERIADDVGIMIAGKIVLRAAVDEIRSQVKRLRIVLSDGKLPAHPPAEMLWQRLSRREWSITVYPFSPQIVQQISQSNAVEHVDVLELSLEEIFKDVARVLYFRLLHGLKPMMGGPGVDANEREFLFSRVEEYFGTPIDLAKRDFSLISFAIVAMENASQESRALHFCSLVDACAQRLPEGKLKFEAQEFVAGTQHRLALLDTVMVFSSSTINANPFDIEDLRGKVVLIEFWTTTCGPCVADRILTHGPSFGDLCWNALAIDVSIA